ncbi:telomeric repeat binding factor a isoform X1 [Ictalurus punctatus]|uniref:Telomeric repeat binding factor a isoform X1 n=1 Tax=Ictalurus punctatus TaxID=7998 RepID=A0A2D0T541_ICTPU|nr:telomeric repeat binding factor a isoform X1 [Ictalurus punctatus]
MASSRKNSNKQLSHEQIINRWSFDFYIFKAFEAFRNEDYESFIELRNLIESLVVRPIDGHTDMTIKLRFLQFLSRIIDGDKLDVTFEKPLTPLESALSVLESICTEMDVPQEILERVHISIREMLIVVCIKSKQFEKAQELLHKHFPKGMDSAGKKKLYVDLMKRRCSTHSVLNVISYSEFKQDMLDFIEKLHHIPEPFLVKMVKVSRQGKTVDVGASCKPQAVRASNVQSCTQDKANRKHTVLLRNSPSNSQQNTPTKNNLSRAPSPALLVTVHLTQGNLKAIYPKLAEQFSVSVPFTQLEEEVEHEAQQENEIDRNMELCLKLTETPMEEVWEEREQSSCVCEERPSDDSLQSQQQCDECCTSVQSDARSKTSVPVKHCTNRDVEQEEESSEVTPSLVDTHVHPPALSAEKGPAGVVSGVSVTQLVMEQDSTPSELEASDSQPLTPSPLQVRSNREDPLSSLSVNSTPVRKYRRPAPHSKTEPASQWKLEVPRSCSTPSSVENSPPPAQCTCDKECEKQATKRLHTRSEGQSEDSVESIVIDSPPSAKQPETSRRLHWMDVSGVQEEWSDEESLFSVSTKTSKGQSSSDIYSKRKKWTDDESDWVKQGVARYGVGRWERIKRAFPFKGRTAVNIKDRWRTMKRLKMV